MIKYNPDQIVSIEFVGEEDCGMYSYRGETSFLGITIQPAGVYGYLGSHVCNLDEVDEFLEKHGDIKDVGCKFVYKSKVIMRMSDGSKHVEYYDDPQDAHNKAISISGRYRMRHFSILGQP